MTALGIVAIGAGGLLIYAGVTGQSALRIVTDTLSGERQLDAADDDAGPPTKQVGPTIPKGTQ